jgi:hypothetical protein
MSGLIEVFPAKSQGISVARDRRTFARRLDFNFVKYGAIWIAEKFKGPGQKKGG